MVDELNVVTQQSRSPAHRLGERWVGTRCPLLDEGAEAFGLNRRERQPTDRGDRCCSAQRGIAKTPGPNW